MKASVAKLSLVMPVRNSQHQIAVRVTQALEVLKELAESGHIAPHAELILVDDGSKDATVEMITAMSRRYPAIRVMRHDRPRGMEAAGQTGLERSTGEVVLMLETDAPFRREDVFQLIRVAEDESIVAARAESSALSPTAPLMRRLRAWAGDADRQVAPAEECSSAIQMIRRPLMTRMTGPTRIPYRLSTERYQTHSV